MTMEMQAVYGEFPVFDYGQYTFLASINPYVKGDGMEHRNSTMITIPTVFDGSSNLLGVFSHEFFHAWNVERIRPKTLEPFIYEKSNMSLEL
jgi:predicted metalloprotease with PDZ domain